MEFIDPTRPDNPYGTVLSEFAGYVKELGELACWQGGRYGCAKSVQDVHFFEKFCLGEVTGEC